MFSLKNFVLKGLKLAVGNMADYKILLNAVGWLDKGVLDENDLAEIEALIDSNNQENKNTESEVE